MMDQPEIRSDGRGLDAISGAIGRPRKAQRIANLLMLEFVFDTLNRAAKRQERQITAVQVGANDGQLADPISDQFVQREWRGLLLEPHPAYFQRATEFHASRDHVVVKNIGGSDTEKEIALHYLDIEHEHLYRQNARGCASLSRERTVKALLKEHPSYPAEKHVSSVNVRLRPIHSVLREEKIDHVDVFVVDVEGHGPQVLEGARLSELKPKIALIEVNRPETLEECLPTFQAIGYQNMVVGDDMLSLSPELANASLIADYAAFMGMKLL